MPETELLKEKRGRFQKLKADVAVMRAKMEKDSDNGKKEYEGIAADRESFIKMTDDAYSLHQEVTALVKAEQIEQEGNEPDEGEKNARKDGLVRRSRKSVGTRVIESDQMKAASAGETKHLERVEVKLDTLTGAAGGFLVFSDRDERIRELPTTAPVLIDNLTVLPTNSNLVEIIVEKTELSQAQIKVVPEGELKPENTMTFDKVNVPIVLIATWIAATRQVLSDAPRLRALIDNRLRRAIRKKLNTMLLAGAGTADELLGFLNFTGTQQRTHRTASNGLGTATDIEFDTFRYAQADLQAKGYSPNLIVMNPLKAATLQTMKDSTGRYLEIYDPVTRTLWRNLVVEDYSMPFNKSAVLDTEMSLELYVRENVQIYTGEPEDFFLKNKFAILAEMRAGLANPYPEGIVEITWP